MDRAKLKARRAAYHARHRDKLNAQVRAWRAADPERARALQRASNERNRDKIKAREAVRREMTREELRQRARVYYAANRKRCIAAQTTYVMRRRAEDPVFHLRMKLATRVFIAIRKQYGQKSARTMELIGCTVDELRAHLEAQFTAGMTWANHTYRGWHIDHIRPCASFDLTDPAQQRACFHYTNLQPMWGVANIRKSNKQECNHLKTQHDKRHSKIIRAQTTPAIWHAYREMLSGH